MARVLAITIAFSAILFVTLARPQEEAPAEGGTTGAPNAACQQYEQQCGQGSGGMAPIQSGIGGGLGQVPGVGGQLNQTQGQLPLDCKQLQQACQQGGNNGLTQPPNQGGAPAMNGSMPNEIPGVGGMNNLTGANPVTGLPIQLPVGK